ncbi:ExbD/TolR family protein [Roseibium sp.]|uniref:ExbD/TolR family protein n=1 Tax=Roseibium sp. TaxID=1936156 RepID=UPI0039EFAA10
MLLIRKPIGKKKRIPLTPLIDVIFILVMFFLLSSTFGVWRPLDVAIGEPKDQTAPNQNTTSPAPAVLIQLAISEEDQTVSLIVNGVDLPMGSLASELDRLAEKGASSAILIPGEGTDFQQVVDVLDVARTSRIGKVSLQLK